MATLEKRYLPPLNPGATITEADRSRVYDLIRKELADVLTGNQSYYPDGVQKDSHVLASGLSGLIGSITDLQSRVDDPSNILGEALKSLRGHARGFQDVIEENEPVDNMEIPRELSPSTRDRNDLYVDPDGGPFSPNPLARDQWKKELEISLDSSPAADGSAPAALIPPTGGPYPADSLAAWLAARASDQQNPIQPSTRLGNNGLRDYYRGDPAWLLQIRQ